MLRLIACLITPVFLLWPAANGVATQADQERKAIKLDAAVYDSYVGQYELTPEFIITVRREENGLSIQATDQPKLEVFAESETKFFLTVVDAQITFVKNEKGEVTHLILHQNGVDQKAKKIDAPVKSSPVQQPTPTPGRQPAPSPSPSPTPSPSPAAVRRPIDLPVEMVVPLAPTPFNAEGKTHLAYELHLTNFSSQDLMLSRLEVFGRDGQPLAKYEGEELGSRLARPGLPQAAEKQRLGGGLRAVVYLWLTFNSRTAVPRSLHHSLTVKIVPPPNTGSTSGDIEISGKGAEIASQNGSSLVLSPPLRGDGWLAANGPSNSSGHRRALIPVGGAAHIAQRFAIDWVRLREDGKTWTGDQLKNENYLAYGAEALAVASATVVAVKDGIPENIPGATSRAVPITLETVGGNYVTLDLGQGQYAFYAHLKPGSLRVKTGDKVKRGQVLGLVGNSGNSTEPHLHFHTSNRNSPLSSEGLPYVFDSFEVQGKGWGWKSSGKDSPVEKRRLELPLQDNVVRFALR